MKKAILYARVARAASDGQKETHNNLPMQLEAMRQYAKTHDLQIVREFQEVYSGAQLERSALNRVREMLARHEAEVLIVYAPDRLSRSLSHLVTLRAEFERAGIELCFVKNFETDLVLPQIDF